MKNHSELLMLAKRVQAIAENGLHYTENDYDQERYGDLEDISTQMISLVTNLSHETIKLATPEKNGYRTPKIDVRCVIFNTQDEVLMVKERVDSCWSLPGGWCDVGYTPTEVAEKEAFEEAPRAIIIAATKEKALEIEGPCFINTVSPCCTEWKFEPKDTILLTDLATDSLMFPMYEILDGHELNILYRPKNVLPVEEYLAAQGRYKHLFKPEYKHIIEKIQSDIDADWAMLQRREEARV